MKEIIELVKSREHLFAKDFAEYLEENGHVYQAFERNALQMHRAGRKHYSARTIIEFLRHSSMISESGDKWKINNNATPQMARLFGMRHPEAAHLFEIRHQSRAIRRIKAV